MKNLLTTSILAFLLIACNSNGELKVKSDQPMDPEKHEMITLGGGCYWCVEAVFQQLEGVISSKSGFMGGHLANPTYEQVVTQDTGHIEVIQVVYDPKIISTKTILEWFWKAHDPTNPLGQGADIGERYTSHIFAHTPEQKALAEQSKTEAQKSFRKPIVTKIKDASEFYEADAEHQDYYFRMKGKNPYCPAVITPKLKKLGLDH